MEKLLPPEVARVRARVVLCQYNGLFAESFYGALVRGGLKVVHAANVLQESLRYRSLVLYPEEVTDYYVILAKDKFEASLIIQLLGVSVFFEVNEYTYLPSGTYTLVPQAEDVTAYEKRFKIEQIKKGLLYFESYLQSLLDIDKVAEPFILKEGEDCNFFYAKVGRYVPLKLFTPGDDKIQFLDELVQYHGSNVRKEVGNE